MPGQPVHFELPASDSERARGFWSGLFGWEFGESAVADFDYRMTQFENGTAAAVYDSPEAGSGPIVYFVSDDIDAQIARTRELGGKADGKQPIPKIGWFARCHDTEGNAFSLFQPDESTVG